MKSFLKKQLGKEKLNLLNFQKLRTYKNDVVSDTLISKCKMVIFSNNKEYIKNLYLDQVSYDEELNPNDFEDFLIPSEKGLHLLNTDIYLDEFYVEVGLKIFEGLKNSKIKVAKTFAPIIFLDEKHNYFYIIAPTLN